MLYMFLLHWDQENPAVTPDEAIAQHLRFAVEARRQGKYICSEALGGTDNAKTVRIRDGKTMVTDGPFIESKEVMGGFYILDCRDLDEALELAARIPDAASSAVEVRAVMQVPGWDYGATADRQRQPMDAEVG